MPENPNTYIMYKKKERTLREERTTFPQRRRTPSFSSSLLDAIYRSIDDEPLPADEMDKSISKKQSNSAPPSRGRSNFLGGEDKEITNLRRAKMVEIWMERQSTSSCNSISSNSSRGGMFSCSSETGSSTKRTPRTNQVLDKQQQKKQSKSEKGQGLNFTRTKLRALKIYGELKKVKQPISPGGRIASFLNSIFNSGSSKKVKMCSLGAMEDVSFVEVNNSNNKPKSSSCSSSFSRSCLSRTPPSSRKSKRSVRFYPISVIVGEDSRPCGHKCIHGEDPGLMPVITRKGFDKGPNLVKEEKKNVSVSVSVSEFGLKGFPSYLNYDSDEEEEEDDMSCSSSELFELDHLIGIGRYREELPVYETTSLKTNQAIANGFFVNQIH